ncbi:hypothetical protein WAB17_13725 [Parerythrobacter aurantius]
MAILVSAKRGFGNALQHFVTKMPLGAILGLHEAAKKVPSARQGTIP